MNNAILNRIRQGDKPAFSMLVERFQQPLFGYLGKMGLSQAVAEEIAQETFIRAWQAREQFDPERAQISTWLFTIARRLAINELQRVAHRHERASKHDGSDGDYPDEKQAQPSAQLEQSQLQRRLYQALQALHPDDRSLLALAYLKELEYSAIAEIEAIPVGTVKSRLYRIRQQLKSTLNAGEAHE